MAKKSDYYQHYAREGRKPIWCCKQFTNVTWSEARQLVKDYSVDHYMRRKGQLRSGKCPEADHRRRRCR